MKPRIRDYGASVRARLLAVARRENVQNEYILLRYAFERFLFRLGKSAYADKFILKGASAFAVWIGPMVRVTRDADFEAFGDASPETLIAAFREICEMEYPEDGVVFDTAGMTAEEIKKEDKYPGVRMRFTARVGGARVEMQIDVGFGDSVYPMAEKEEYPVLLGGACPEIRVYPVHTAVAEKFHTMVTRGVLNSRLKDYYDIRLLSDTFEFDAALLRTAVRRTFDRRGTDVPSGLPEGLSENFSRDANKQIQWMAFLRKIGAVNCDLTQAVEDIREFILPILTDNGSSVTAKWSPLSRKWKDF